MSTVHIKLRSHQTDGDQQEVTQQDHLGSLDVRDDKRYLRYAEPGIQTTIVLGDGEVTIYRRGEVESWQVFQPGELTGGRLSLGAGEMVLRVHTTRCEVGEGSLRLAYELLAAESGEPDADPTRLSLGEFSLALDWSEVSG